MTAAVSLKIAFASAERLIPILVACALDLDSQNSLNMGGMISSKRASTTKNGIIPITNNIALFLAKWTARRMNFQLVSERMVRSER
ncbi:MAG: hypothetical protein BRC43_07995 [Cyanobacteria bacterium QS_3_48_167]|nr:MAG: hypothetical protein BRC43_07995 [Cyanobacteria bacterium QS_3_48_167]